MGVSLQGKELDAADSKRIPKMAKAYEDKPLPGVRDLSEPHGHHGGKSDVKSTGYWRVHVYVPSTAESVSPDTVVKARDDIEAEARGFKELGILSVNKTECRVEVSPVQEADFIKAQAKRTGVDLRSKECRKTKKDDGTDIAEED